MGLTYCCAEDRDGAEIGLKLLVLSVAEHSPGVPLVMYRPRPLPEFALWLRRFPQVRLIAEPLPGASSWNTKPHALLPWVQEDGDVAVWLDSDVMLSGDPRVRFQSLSEETLGITEEPSSHPDPGMRPRTEAWGLEPGRERGITVNSCVIRVTVRHRALLLAWRGLLEQPDYRDWQARPVSERPVAMKTDQDVFNALLGAKKFEDIPVVLFRSGREVIHSGGALAYTLADRLMGLFRPMPTFIHAISVKPWVILHLREDLTGRMWWWRRLLQEMSPYVALARRYRGQVDEPMAWLDWRTPFGGMMRVLGCGHWALRGLPVTAAATLLRCLRRTSP